MNAGAPLAPFHMYEITLDGPPRHRGRVHGETIRQPIGEAVGAFSEAIGSVTHADPRSIYRRMFEETDFRPVAERWTPNLIEETRGIGEGAGIDFDTILAWQFLQEVVWFVLERYPAAQEALGCTALGSYPADGPTILAQTADNPPFILGRQTLLHLTNGAGIQSHVLTFPGIVGVYGLNDRGIGVCINAMVGQMNHSPAGLGAPFIARGVLAKTTFAAADQFIRAVPHASGNTFTIAGPGRVVAYECSPNRVEAYVPAPDEAITCHTNHPLADGDRKDPDNGKGLENSIARFEVVQHRLQSSPQPLSWETARRILSDHEGSFPICRHPDPAAESVTCFGIIMECWPDPVLHASAGPPCSSEFRDFGFPIRNGGG